MFENLVERDVARILKIINAIFLIINIVAIIPLSVMGAMQFRFGPHSKFEVWLFFVLLIATIFWTIFFYLVFLGFCNIVDFCEKGFPSSYYERRSANSGGTVGLANTNQPQNTQLKPMTSTPGPNVVDIKKFDSCGYDVGDVVLNKWSIFDTDPHISKGTNGTITGFTVVSGAKCATVEFDVSGRKVGAVVKISEIERAK